jgi:Mrp family chromosome partitioning ATPase
MSKYFKLLQQTSSEQELFQMSDDPAGLVGTADDKPSPASGKKFEPKVVRSNALPIRLPGLIKEKARSWGRQLPKRGDYRQTDLEAIIREEEIKLVQRIFPTTGQRSPQIVLFSGVESEAGCASICIRTSEILAARSEGSVCLVDANLQSPCLHQYLRVDNFKGLAEAVLESGPVQDFTQKLPDCNLWVMPSGSATAQLSFPGAYDRLRSRIAELGAEFRFVVIHSSPLHLDAASILLSRWTDGVVLVLEANRTRRETARRMKQNLEAANVSVLGVVLNNRTFPVPEALYRRL